MSAIFPYLAMALAVVVAWSRDWSFWACVVAGVAAGAVVTLVGVAASCRR